MPEGFAEKKIAFRFGALLAIEALMYYLLIGAILIDHTFVSWVMAGVALVVTFAMFIMCMITRQRTRAAISWVGWIALVAANCIAGINLLMFALFLITS